MEWARWKPMYLEILSEFEYDPAQDERSAEMLSKMIGIERTPRYSDIVDLMGHHVSICGPASSLEMELDTMSGPSTLVSAGSATERLLQAGWRPDIIVTDLDGSPEADIEANSKGALAFVHAHGDNIPLLKEWVPRMTGAIVPTAQCKPFGNMYNFGGFTDGDRAFLIAKHFGAKEILLMGWDLESPAPKQGRDPMVKQRKLNWASRIINDEGCLLPPLACLRANFPKKP